MRLFASVLLYSSLAPLTYAAGNGALDGRWDIRVADDRSPKAWWLEIDGARTATPTGKFVGAPGGQMDVIKDLAISGDEIRFTFDRQWQGQKPFHGVWTARLANGKLEGKFFRNDAPAATWTGVRAPVIDETDDGTWKEGKPVALFNGEDLSGWRALAPGRDTGWVVKDGLMSNQGGAQNIISDAKFWNFVLHAEFRLQEHSNSGIGLRGRYEVQIMEDYGRPVDGHSSGTIYGRILPTINASKKPGEWQTYDVRLVGRQVTVVYNGVKVIDRKIIEGLTAIAMDPNEGEPGPIVLQGDHGPVEIRSLVITPLVK